MVESENTQYREGRPCVENRGNVVTVLKKVAEIVEMLN